MVLNVGDRGWSEGRGLWCRLCGWAVVWRGGAETWRLFVLLLLCSAEGFPCCCRVFCCLFRVLGRRMGHGPGWLRPPFPLHSTGVLCLWCCV